jgi:hypothetical protein
MLTELELRVCPICEHEFEQTQLDQIYCASACKRRADKRKNRRKKTCKRKDKFATPELAWRFALLNSNPEWRPCGVYRCKVCEYYHLTTRR